MTKSLALPAATKETTLVLRDPKGNEVKKYRVEVFFDSKDETFGVRFLDGEWLKGVQAVLPAHMAAQVIGKAAR